MNTKLCNVPLFNSSIIHYPDCIYENKPKVCPFIRLFHHLKQKIKEKALIGPLPLRIKKQITITNQLEYFISKLCIRYSQ